MHSIAITLLQEAAITLLIAERDRQGDSEGSAAIQELLWKIEEEYTK
jgi:hypothetical protein